MKFAFKELPGAEGGYLRPVVPVRLDGQSFLVACLLDTGSLHNRFGAWVAETIGLDLAATEPEDLALGGVLTRSRSIPIDLSVDGMTWRAPVSFCDPWPFSFHLLGQEGFFRFFHASIRASRNEFALTPEAGSPQ